LGAGVCLERDLEPKWMLGFLSAIA